MGGDCGKCKLASQQLALPTQKRPGLLLRGPAVCNSQNQPNCRCYGPIGRLAASFALRPMRWALLARSAARPVLRGPETVHRQLPARAPGLDRRSRRRHRRSHRRCSRSHRHRCGDRSRCHNRSRRGHGDDHLAGTGHHAGRDDRSRYRNRNPAAPERSTLAAPALRNKRAAARSHKTADGNHDGGHHPSRPSYRRRPRGDQTTARRPAMQVRRRRTSPPNPTSVEPYFASSKYLQETKRR